MASIKPYEKNGKIYYMFQLYIYTDLMTGKVRKSTRRGFKTKKEAQLELARLQLEIDKGTYTRPPVEMYREAYNLWIVQYENTVEESTFSKTLSIFKNHVLPQLGDYKIDKINIKMCEQTINHWFKKPARYRMVKAYASKVLDYAIKLELIQSNPMKLVSMPTKRVDPTEDEEELNFYSKEELLHFLKCLEQENNFKAYALFRILAFSGMRKGEALSLT
ncbi:Arm DNA-binding domain-containing protein [Lysinibacillus sp. LZ02]|uniref:Arm DNA-binding domain-containing protein n=1 Tax=Lysinibacillus sp. LZ02 TaxID=3420668 RepID=UPI003D367E1A